MLGINIKRYLDQKGIKYSYIAESIGVSNSAFSSMINENRNITAEEYFKICDVLKVSFYQFKNDKNDTSKAS